MPISYDWYYDVLHRHHREGLRASTGSSSSTPAAGIGIAFTQSFTDKLKLKQLNGDAASGVGGSVKTKTAKLDTFALGASTLHNVLVSSEDINLDADGLIGFDLLAGAIAHLDLDAGNLTLYDPTTSDLSKLVTSGIPLTVGMNRGIPMVPMQIDGRIPVNAMLDTGNPMYVLFGPDLIYKDHLVMMRHGAIMAGVGGYEFVECGAVGEISMGPVKYASRLLVNRNRSTGTPYLSVSTFSPF